MKRILEGNNLIYRELAWNWVKVARAIETLFSLLKMIEGTIISIPILLNNYCGHVVGDYSTLNQIKSDLVTPCQLHSMKDIYMFLVDITHDL